MVEEDSSSQPLALEDRNITLNHISSCSGRVPKPTLNILESPLHASGIFMWSISCAFSCLGQKAVNSGGHEHKPNLYPVATIYQPNWLYLCNTCLDLCSLSIIGLFTGLESECVDVFRNPHTSHVYIFKELMIYKSDRCYRSWRGVFSSVKHSEKSAAFMVLGETVCFCSWIRVSFRLVKRLVTYLPIFLSRKSIKHGKDVIVLPLNAVLQVCFRDAIGTNLIYFSCETLLSPMFWHCVFSSSLWGRSVPGNTRTKSFCNYWSCHRMLIASDLQGCL